VRFDAHLRYANDLPGIIAQARSARDGAVGCIWAGESSYDPLPRLAIVAEHAPATMIGTSVLVAFARSPMTVAYGAFDLHRLSGGRFVLGLGSQVRRHIVGRFDMPWSRPADRMREYVSAVRAIWHSWEHEEPLAFDGSFYSHARTDGIFRPAPLGCAPPKIMVAAVGERMTRVAAETDGLLAHPFTTTRFLAERTIPAIVTARGGRDGFEVCLSGLVVTGTDEESMTSACAEMRSQIAYYASTPAYRNVLALHGWADLGEELHRLSRCGDQRRWRQRGELIDDEVLHAFAVVDEPERLVDAVRARFDGLVDRFAFSADLDADGSVVARAFRGDLTDRSL
jgi:probable F420-dependent oxidoreductase